MDLLPLACGSVAVGVAVGILSGLLGVGGGTVLVPVFRLLYGMPAIAATATSLFTIIPTSLSGVATHVRNKTCVLPLGLAAGIGGAAMSPVGVWLASISPEWAIMVAAAAVIAYSSITMFRKAVALRCKQKRAADAASEGRLDETPLPELPPRRRLVGVGLAIGLGAGAVSGYVGVGGGFIMVPLFMQVLGTPLRLTSGTSLVAVTILAVPAAVMQAVLGNIDWLAGILVSIGTIPGAALGSKLITRVPEFALRLTFGAFLLVAAALLVVNQLGVL